MHLVLMSYRDAGNRFPDRKLYVETSSSGSTSGRWVQRNALPCRSSRVDGRNRDESSDRLAGRLNSVFGTNVATRLRGSTAKHFANVLRSSESFPNRAGC